MSRREKGSSRRRVEKQKSSHFIDTQAIQYTDRLQRTPRHYTDNTQTSHTMQGRSNGTGPRSQTSTRSNGSSSKQSGSGNGYPRVANCRRPDRQRARKKVNVSKILRSSIVSERYSMMSSQIDVHMGQERRGVGPVGNGLAHGGLGHSQYRYNGKQTSPYRPDPAFNGTTPLGSVPVLGGECSFEQTYAISVSPKDVDMMGAGNSQLEQLHALRDVMERMTDNHGFIDRATFSQAFEVDEGDYADYNGDNGMIDGHAILIDAVMELDVHVDEKLRFIFDTIDVHRVGAVAEDQVVALMTTNFAAAKLDVLGPKLNDVAKMMFQKVGIKPGGLMNYGQFREVFHSYVEKQDDKMKTNNRKAKYVRPTQSQSKFGAWYDAQKIRLWWLLIYILGNNAAFWIKWHMYEVDPALGYGLRIARGCAQVVMLNSLLVLLPMCRSITQVMKRSRLLWKYIPFDDHIEFHKLCGSVLLIAGLIHTGAHVSNEIHLFLLATPEQLKHSIFVKNKIPGFENGTLPPFTNVLMALPIWTGVLLLIITLIAFPLAAIPKFRQGKFNLFWYSHMLFGPFLLIMACHGALSWLARSSSYMWVGPPFIIYLVERRFRYAKMFVSPVRIMEAVELDQTVAVFMEKPKRFVYRPGMYLFICCPQISSHEWHPFTISSAPGDNYVSIHMRGAGDWTNAFHQLIADCHKKERPYPEVYLDGPVGAPTQDYHRFKTVMCIAGGIGVTPFASVLKDVVHIWEEFRCKTCDTVRHPSSFRLQKLYFHWTTRAQESLGWFDDTMNQISRIDRDRVIEAHQYLTTVKENEQTNQLRMFQEFVHEQTGQDMVSGLKSNTLTHFGRPVWDDIFTEMVRKHPNEEIGVFFCGPHALDRILGEMCQKYSSNTRNGTQFDYHSEKFA